LFIKDTSHRTNHPWWEFDENRTAQYYLDLYTPPLFHGKNQTLVLGFVVNGE
jgi:hypothetical protein